MFFLNPKYINRFSLIVVLFAIIYESGTHISRLRQGNTFTEMTNAANALNLGKDSSKMAWYEKTLVYLLADNDSVKKTSSLKQIVASNTNHFVVERGDTIVLANRSKEGLISSFKIDDTNQKLASLVIGASKGHIFEFADTENQPSSMELLDIIKHR